MTCKQKRNIYPLQRNLILIGCKLLYLYISKKVQLFPSFAKKSFENINIITWMAIHYKNSLNYKPMPRRKAKAPFCHRNYLNKDGIQGCLPNYYLVNQVEINKFWILKNIDKIYYTSLGYAKRKKIVNLSLHIWHIQNSLLLSNYIIFLDIITSNQKHSFNLFVYSVQKRK